MKSLILFRHGKSDWNASYDEDHERPLAARGERAAAAMGRMLALAGQTPDVTLCSTALRSRSTVALAAAAGNWTMPIRSSRDFYRCDVDSLFDHIRALDDEFESVLFCGHEPTCGEAVARIVGGSGFKFVTGCMAKLQFDAERWSEVGAAGRLVWMLPPKLFTRGEFDFASTDDDEP